MSILFEFYLVFGVKDTRYGLSATPPRCTVKKPSVSASEIAMSLSIRLPESLFVKPMLEATVVVPDGDVTPLIVTPEMQTDIARVLHEQLGLRMNISTESGSQS